MLKAIAIRVLLAALTVAIGGLLSAVLVRCAPGFGVDERQLDVRLNSDSREAIRREAEDQRDISRFYLQSLTRMVHGDLGVSPSLNRPIRALMAERGPVTLRLVAIGLALSWASSVLLVLGRWTLDFVWFDTLGRLISGALLCIPTAGLALLLVMLDLPAYLAMALVVLPKSYQLLSSLLGAAASMPHVISAKAKGAGAVRILGWHMVAVVRRELLALIGVSVGIAVSAAIPVEALTGTPGIGQLAWQAAMARDLPVLLTVSLAVIACTVLANSGADLFAGGQREGG